MTVSQTDVALSAFLLAMAMYPDVQKKAQSELDMVVGIERLPEFSDLSSLPYLNALIKELWRWHPVLLMAVPHCSTNEDTYDGYFIPSGTVVIPNVW